MKLTKSKLQKIIREEIDKVALNEIDKISGSKDRAQSLAYKLFSYWGKSFDDLYMIKGRWVEPYINHVEQTWREVEDAGSGDSGGDKAKATIYQSNGANDGLVVVITQPYKALVATNEMQLNRLML